ncbi:TatD family hydrolase [archaeon]|nr:TatD family hydrolase [archaeon]
MFVDSHCHLTELDNLGKAIQDAAKSKVELMLSNSVDFPSCTANLQIQKDFPEAKALLGLHPSELLQLTELQLTEAFDFIELHLNEAVGIGETGLDFNYAKTPEQRKLQLSAFNDFIELSLDFDKAICVHSRKARQEAIDALLEAKAGKALMHWFYGSDSQLKTILDNGWFISFGPSILYSRSLHSFLSKVPLASILLETDCPVAFDGKPSEPSWIPLVARKVAELKKVSLQDVEETTTQNAFNLFKL